MRWLGPARRQTSGHDLQEGKGYDRAIRMARSSTMALVDSIMADVVRNGAALDGGRRAASGKLVEPIVRSVSRALKQVWQLLEGLNLVLACYRTSRCIQSPQLNLSHGGLDKDARNPLKQMNRAAWVMAYCMP